VAVVLDALRVVMRIPNSDPLSLIGRVIKITNRVPRIHRSVGAINAGAIKGIFTSFGTATLMIDITLMKIFIVANLIC